MFNENHGKMFICPQKTSTKQEIDEPIQTKAKWVSKKKKAGNRMQIFVVENKFAKNSCHREHISSSHTYFSSSYDSLNALSSEWLAHHSTLFRFNFIWHKHPYTIHTYTTVYFIFAFSINNQIRMQTKR